MTKSEYDKKRYLMKKADIDAHQKKYYELNKSKISERKRLYKIRKRQTDPIFKLSERIRKSIGCSIKRIGGNKTTNTTQILGCTFKEFKVHIENKFEPWMNWQNYGHYKPTNIQRTWCLDHIIPLASALNQDDVVRLNHFSNIRPLCSKENSDKRDKFI